MNLEAKVSEVQQLLNCFLNMAPAVWYDNGSLIFDSISICEVEIECPTIRGLISKQGYQAKALFTHYVIYDNDFQEDVEIVTNTSFDVVLRKAILFYINYMIQNRQETDSYANAMRDND
jgi:hypothetical protein